MVANDRDNGGVSRNGSLGALGRLARVFVAIGGEDPGWEMRGCEGRGWDCTRECVGKVNPNADTLDEREFGDRTSSKPSTWQGD